MPSILSHHSTNATKVLLIGDSGTGKTGALASLVLAGYKLRIMDLDNGLDVLKNYLTDSSSSYAKELTRLKIDLEEAVQYVTLTEHMKSVNGNMIPVKATVWNRAMNIMTRWKDGDVDLGEPRKWDRNHIVVIDSLTMLSTAALNWIQSLNGRLGNFVTGYDSQRDIGQAQTQLERFLQLLYDDEFNPNVVVISHIMYRDPESAGRGPSVGADGKAIASTTFTTQRGYPSSLGRALAPRIPRYFNNVLQTETEGSGQSTRRKIYTVPQGTVSLKSSAPMRVQASYDIADGMVKFFTAVRGPTITMGFNPATSPSAE